MTTVPVVRFTVAGEEIGAVDAPPPCETCEYTVVYDGACKVCTRLSGVLRKWDGAQRLEVIPSQTPGVRARFPWIPARAYVESLQMIHLPTGRTWQGAAAIEQLLNVLPKGKLISWLFKLPFMRRFADWFYRWFARNRYKLGCGEHCQFKALAVEWQEDGE